MMKVLIKHGADPLFKDGLKQSVIFYLAKEGKIKCMQYLESLGAELDS